MEIKVGDKVRYLNAKGGGVVSRIINQQLVEVLDESGFDIPFQKSELVKIEDKPMSVPSAFSKSKEPVVVKQEIVKSLIPDTDDEISGNEMPRLLYAFVPIDESLSAFELYIINDCNYHFLYTLGYKKEKLIDVFDIQTIEANTKVFIKQFSKEKIEDLKSLFIQGVFFKKKGFSVQQPVSREITISAVKFFKGGCFKENDFFDEPAMVETIYEKSLADEIKQIDGKTFQKVVFSKEQADKKLHQSSKKENKEERNTVREVDLHIHELVENEQGLTPGDKLDIQLKHFEKELNVAILNNEKRVVFIHGVGNGVLKLKIKSILETKYPKLKFQDASFQKYKFGATMVML